MQYYQKHTIIGSAPLTWNFLYLEFELCIFPGSTNAISLILSQLALNCPNPHYSL